MDVRIKPAHLSGKVAAIASKSEAHRLLICAALSETESELNINKRSEDIDATIECLRALGAEITIDKADETRVSVKPVKKDVISGTPLLDCGESGSTLRFMLPVAAAVAKSVSFTGSGRLPERPIGELMDAMKKNGVVTSSEKLPLTLTGGINPGVYEIPGSVSSQYITGLLLALPLLSGKSKIVLTSKLESAAYVDITLDVLKRFGVVFETETDEKGCTTYTLPEGKKFEAPAKVKVDGDWSNGAFFLVAGALGNGVEIEGLSPDSPQGDKEILTILKKFGAEVTAYDDIIKVSPGNLKGTVIDINETPDLLPVLAVLASFAEGETEFVNGARLRIKESDRLESTAAMINALGGCAIEKPEGLIVRGQSDKTLKGGTVSSYRDHRIAMSASIAATRCGSDVVITDAHAVAKSYPDFYNDYKKLGGIVDVI